MGHDDKPLAYLKSFPLLSVDQYLTSTQHVYLPKSNPSPALSKYN